MFVCVCVCATIRITYSRRYIETVRKTKTTTKMHSDSAGSIFKCCFWIRRGQSKIG